MNAHEIQIIVILAMLDIPLQALEVTSSVAQQLGLANFILAALATIW
jgi:hypothetical protein